MQAELYWIDSQHSLAIMPRPRAGDWLEDEIASWKHQGIDAVLSLLEDEEIEELGLESEAALCKQVGLAFLSFPVPDRAVPTSVAKFLDLFDDLYLQWQSGTRLGIHCRIGVGRSATFAACFLVRAGMSVSDALAQISERRGLSVPDNHEQITWVTQLSRTAAFRGNIL